MSTKGDILEKPLTVQLIYIATLKHFCYRPRVCLVVQVDLGTRLALGSHTMHIIIAS